MIFIVLSINVKVTLFPDQNQYDRWKAVAEKWDFKISKDCEICHEQVLISKSDDIADYYLNIKVEVDAAPIAKVDTQWNQAEWDELKAKMSGKYEGNYRNRPYTPLKKT